MNAICSNLLALVRDVGGITAGQGVVIGVDPAALEALGETWRVGQGGQEGLPCPPPAQPEGFSSQAPILSKSLPAQYDRYRRRVKRHILQHGENRPSALLHSYRLAAAYVKIRLAPRHFVRLASGHS